ncbi:MAG: beta-lactamase family protein [Saprospiraceae bacterium]|nr:beta-lactamase family protein [Saprospiraceae bacterium]
MRKTSRSCLDVLVLFLCWTTLLGQSNGLVLSETSPGSVSMSAERLARIDAMCKKAVDDGNIPGVVALVARRGKIVYHEAFGQADAVTKRALKRDDIFRIASQSKAITATAVMILYEEGHFQLDDPISKYIPAFSNPQVLNTFRYSDTTYTARPALREITIRHLLTHTSGIGYGFIDGDERFQMLYHKAGVTDAFSAEPITIEESMLKLAELPLHHDPGEKYTYSEGLDVLGYLIEVISGQSFAQFLKARLFDPLEMNDTHFYLPTEKAGRLVAVQTKSDDQWKNFTTDAYNINYPIEGAKSYYSGGAGLSSTAKDYAKFLQMYLNDGGFNGHRILSRTTIDFMMDNQFDNIWSDTENYVGLAFGVTTKKGEATGHSGSEGTFRWGGYYNTQYWADPEEGLIGVIMKQTRGPISDPTNWKFKILATAAIDD